jgi:PAS domain S-box-containing protein
VTDPQPRTNAVAVAEAASILAMSEDGVLALAGAGYLRATDDGPDGPRFSVGDVKALQARLTDGGHDDLFFEDPDAVDPQALIGALDGRADEMARRAYDIFQTVFPESTQWSLSKQARFIEQAKGRFEAILAVTAHGEDVDLTSELQEVGAVAAWAGSPLPQLLVVLRISRDLVVQTAVELAEERGRHWGLALSLLLTRVLPAIDRLTDAIAQGYWAAVVGREEEDRARYESVVEHSSDGVYEVDLEGCIQYANPSLAMILGVRLADLEGQRLTDVLVPSEPGSGIEQLMNDSGGRVEVGVVRRDGVRRDLVIRTVARHNEGEVVGFQGLVRDATVARELEAQKNEFLALITQDLRQPLTTILGLGVTLESYATELPPERTQRMGTSIRHQSERIARLADDLYDVSRIEDGSLMLSPRTIDLAATVDVALTSVLGPEGVEVRVPAGLEVHADARRVEQVVANLVENALVHGEAPVVVEGKAVGHEVELSVSDRGAGVPPVLLPTLFSQLRTLGRADRDRGRGTGLGLSLVRGLVEAMGGRVWYEPGAGGGSCFRLTLPTPRAHRHREPDDLDR